MDFVHLHLHTQYSFLDGAIRVSDLMPRVKELGMSAVAITDHGALFGAIDFQMQAQSKSLKPIIGVNAYIVENHKDSDKKGTVRHLTLIAKNLEGYKNLIHLNSIAWLEGLHRDRDGTLPCIDFELLSQFKEGLICLSGDLGGEVPRAILRNERNRAVEIITRYRDLFGPEHYYLELTRASLPEYGIVSDALIELGQELGVPVVAANDCHYLREEDALAHAVLMAIQLEQTIDLDTALSHGLTDLYVKSPEEMIELFSDIPEAIENTVKIADMCDLKIPTGEVYLPLFDVPESFETDPSLSKEERISTYFSHLAHEGLEARLVEFDRLNIAYDRESYVKRLELEIGVIQEMRFPGYFLIVADFIQWAKSQEIPVGPGRGSGAGSLVAYSLGITDIDPLPYNLLFERFLNPERVSMPDFDVDFCKRRRQEVIEYVANKYGANNVAQIATFGQLKPRAAIRDVGRALNVPLSEVDKLSKLVPDDLSITLESALAQVDELVQMRKNNETIDQLFEISLGLENLYRQAGLHAAGIVISEGPLWDYVPVFKGVNDETVSQYAKFEVEQAGLVKFDFLGLKTLTLIDDAVKLINRQRRAKGEKLLDLREITFDDPKVYELISSGNTDGVFQIESDGFKRLIMQLRPDCFEDIVAAVALYRPGPLGANMVDSFVKRKHGEEAIDYPHPSLEPVLAPTYGMIVYQEQVMQITQVISGFSLGQADLLRRAMGKKDEKKMAAQKIPFVAGAEKNGHSEKFATDLFALLEKFAEYGFNKSHSAAYAVLTYQTAWLKTHYQVEFMAALMTNDKDNTDKVVRYINEARHMGIEVLPPDVNHSELDFSVTDNRIRFGLGAIKGLGVNIGEKIIEYREDSPYASLYDFCARIPSKELNKRTVECLIYAGALDFISPEASEIESCKSSKLALIANSRAKMLGATETALSSASKKQRDEEMGQGSLFALFSSSSESEAVQDFYPDDEMDIKTALLHEKGRLGFYVSGHPLEPYQRYLANLGVVSISSLRPTSRNEFLRCAGMISELSIRTLRKSSGRMASFRLEDISGSIQTFVYSNKIEEINEDYLKGDLPVLVEGSVRESRLENNVNEFIVNSISLLDDVCFSSISELSIVLEYSDDFPEKVRKFMELVASCKEEPSLQKCQVHFFVTRKVEDSTIEISFTAKDLLIALDEPFLARCTILFGEDAVGVLH